jgi:hypothetical protein
MTTLAWKDGLPNWLPISKLPQLVPPPVPSAGERAPPSATRPRGNSKPPPNGVQKPMPGMHAYPPTNRPGLQRTNTHMNAAL